MAKLWEIYASASPEERGILDSRVRDIAHLLSFERPDFPSATEIMRTLYSTQITKGRLKTRPNYFGTRKKELVRSC